MTDISIIIPTFDRLWALPQAVDSCFGSKCTVEVIVVDDGSSDGTWEWLQGRRDVVALRTANRGKCAAVNTAMERAQGDYVRFLDSDDWLKPGANDGQLALARQAGADIVLAGYEDFREAGVAGQPPEIRPHPWVDCDDFVAQQFGEVPFSHYSAFLFRRSFIAGIPHRPEFALRDDRMVMLEAAIARPRLAVWREPAFVHRHHGRGRLQETSGARRMEADQQNIAVYARAVALLESRGELSPRRKRAAVSYVWPVVRNLAKRDLSGAAKAAAWIFALDPAFVPPERPSILSAYKVLGFAATERLIRGLDVFRPRPGS